MIAQLLNALISLAAIGGMLVVASGIFIVVLSIAKGDLHERRLNGSDQRLRQQMYDRRNKLQTKTRG